MYARIYTSFVGVVGLLLSGASYSMDFRLSGSTLVMSGPVVSDDLARLKDHLATGMVKLIVLHQSPGGDLWNGFQLGERIRYERIPTAVSGKCESACGLIFLGGVARSFTDARPLGQTMVGLHGAHHRETKQPLPGMSYQVSYFIRRMTDEKYPSDLLERTVYPNDPRDFVFFFIRSGSRIKANPVGSWSVASNPTTSSSARWSIPWMQCLLV